MSTKKRNRPYLFILGFIVLAGFTGTYTHAENLPAGYEYYNPANATYVQATSSDGRYQGLLNPNTGLWAYGKGSFLVPAIKGAGSVASDTKITITGHEFVRLSEDDLKKLGVTDVKKFGKAWRDESGMVWGDMVTSDMKSREEAKAYCGSIGAKLPSGYGQGDNGLYGFPNEDSDFVRLSKYMGATDESYLGYVPQILPNLGYLFISSSTNFRAPKGNFSIVFWGLNGSVLTTQVNFYSDSGYVRCVVAPKY